MNHIAAINEISASEGVFTAAQALRLGITRNALSNACATRRAERICHGAYRLVGVQSSITDELSAIWKLTNPAHFTWERMRKWDGVAVGGATAANLLELGGFLLSPYRIYGPKRINSRIKSASFGVRAVAKEDVTWLEGLPVTKPERTLVDLCLDREDPSLIADAFRDADAKGLDMHRLEELMRSLEERPRDKSALRPLWQLIENRRREEHEV